FKVDRGILLASVNFAMECAEQAQAAANQVSLFGGEDDQMQALQYVKAAPWSDRQRLAEEKAALGFYLSGHPFESYAEETRKFVRSKLADLAPAREPRLI